jgi:hypothetical protein
MPLVYQFGGFTVHVLLPPREHGPAHVHVWKAGASVVVTLEPIGVRKVDGMRTSDVVKAVRLVEENDSYLLMMWRQFHAD